MVKWRMRRMRTRRYEKSRRKMRGQERIMKRTGIKNNTGHLIGNYKRTKYEFGVKTITSVAF